MLIAQRPTLTEESLNPQRSRFTIEPLEPGFGYTLGNSLRRTLLSSIPGAAVTSVRISGALHEFTTLPGVQEDVTEILLNIKGIVLTSEYDEPVVMYLRKSGKGEAVAGDITPPAGVTIANPEQHIATLADDGELEIEFTVERGRGYVPAQMNKQDNDEIGRIPVDSIYSPVLKVSYKVEATRVEQRTDFDKHYRRCRRPRLRGHRRHGRYRRYYLRSRAHPERIRRQVGDAGRHPWPALRPGRGAPVSLRRA